MSPRLSVVMIAKNAADLLPDCLASVSWADEIVLLDSGSSDNTVEFPDEERIDLSKAHESVNVAGRVKAWWTLQQG